MPGTDLPLCRSFYHSMTDAERAAFRRAEGLCRYTGAGPRARAGRAGNRNWLIAELLRTRPDFLRADGRVRWRRVHAALLQHPAIASIVGLGSADGRKANDTLLATPDVLARSYRAWLRARGLPV